MASADAEELVKQLQAQLNAQGQLDAESLSSLVRQLDKDQNDWCEAAGQSEPLTTRLKNLLKDYPADVGLFKEMVQNADDAGAGRVHFVWDTRKLAKQSLLTPEMAAWQTNCLWAYNDAIFTEQDRVSCLLCEPSTACCSPSKWFCDHTQFYFLESAKLYQSLR